MGPYGWCLSGFWLLRCFSIKKHGSALSINCKLPFPLCKSVIPFWSSPWLVEVWVSFTLSLQLTFLAEVCFCFFWVGLLAVPGRFWTSLPYFMHRLFYMNGSISTHECFCIPLWTYFFNIMCSLVSLSTLKIKFVSTWVIELIYPQPLSCMLPPVLKNIGYT